MSQLLSKVTVTSCSFTCSICSPCCCMTHSTGDAIDRAIGQWRRRLECVVQQQGGYIEHFNQSINLFVNYLM